VAATEIETKSMAVSAGVNVVHVPERIVGLAPGFAHHAIRRLGFRFIIAPSSLLVGAVMLGFL
jgi:hypothetical protein